MTLARLAFTTTLWNVIVLFIDSVTFVTIPFYRQAYQGASHLMLPSVVDMSLLDDDDMDELSSEIYEIEHDQLQLGQLIGQVFHYAILRH